MTCLILLPTLLRKVSRVCLLCSVTRGQLWNIRICSWEPSDSSAWVQLDRGAERDKMLGTSIPESVMLTQPLTRISLSVLRHLLEDRVKRLRSEIFVLERCV